MLSAGRVVFMFGLDRFDAEISMDGCGFQGFAVALFAGKVGWIRLLGFLIMACIIGENF